MSAEIRWRVTEIILMPEKNHVNDGVLVEILY